MFERYTWRNLPLIPLSFVLLATLWGGSFVAIEVGVREVPPLLFAAVRYDVAGLLVLAFAAATGRWRPRGRDDVVGIAIVGAFVICAHHAFLYVGQRTVPGAVAAALVALAPVLTALVAARLLPEERLDPSGYVGVVVGFLGVLVIASPWSAAGAPPAGVALVFLGTAAFAVGSVLLRRVRPVLPLRALQGWGMLLGAGLLHVGSLARGEGQALAWSPTALLAATFLIVGPGVVAFLLYFRLLGSVGATQTSLVAYLEPPAAAALSWALFGYVPTAAEVAGFALVLAGFALLKREATLRIAGRARRSVA